MEIGLRDADAAVFFDTEARDQEKIGLQALLARLDALHEELQQVCDHRPQAVADVLREIKQVCEKIDQQRR